MSVLILSERLFDVNGIYLQLWNAPKRVPHPKITTHDRGCAKAHPYSHSHTLNRNRIISPSCTTYSLPSERMRPFSLAAFSLPQETISS